MRVHWVQHVAFEDLGAIADWATDRGHEITTTFAPTRGFPDPGTFDVLVVMGGPMGVHDVAAYPWLEAEKAFLASVISADSLVFGVCLGAQLLAEALGADVRHGSHREIGWYEVDLTPDGLATPPFSSLPERFVAFHWHADTFSTPEGASRTATSRAFANQAFSFGEGRIVGVQFHLEATADGVRRLIANCGNDLETSRWVQPVAGLVAGEQRWGASARRYLFGLLDSMVAVPPAVDGRDQLE